MAIGWSGSNGGISEENKKMALGLSGSNGGISEEKRIVIGNPILNSPLEISYFINNICNLNCRHCYVGYDEKNGELNVDEWKRVFNDLIGFGALTFGNVGKEPLLSWDKTKSLMEFLYKKREDNPKLRFGIVTNAISLDKRKINEFSEINPTYIDISLDGTKKEHDYIRGEGNFERTINNLKLIYETNPELSEKVFISNVLMRHNKEKLRGMIDEVIKYGVKKFLISPYVKTENGTPSRNLLVSEDEIVDYYKDIISGKLFTSKDNKLEIILKNDYDTLKPIMDKCVEEGIIDLKNLFVDEYTTIFNKYDFGSNKVIINYIPKKQTFSKEIRISHDGYVSNCYAQFFKNYPERDEVVGNIKEKSITKILKPYLTLN